MSKRIVFHIDVNSAYLSWEAVYRLSHGATLDLRDVPSIVGGNPKTRRGIILAKSIPAKKFGIQTGEVLFKALQKCPTLEIVPPNYSLYIKSSRAMVEILEEYSAQVERYSIDECFMEFTDMAELYGNPEDFANMIKDRIHDELGFTVNIGIGPNKLLAKVASELKKPNMVHTLFPNEEDHVNCEMRKKMWPLPVEDLFMVGRRTKPKLNEMGIYTIGDLAKFDLELLKYKLKSFGEVIHNYANGREDSMLHGESYSNVKGIGNSTTIPFDVTERRIAHLYLLSLTEMVAMRMRDANFYCSLVAISIRTNELTRYSHQRKLYYATDNTEDIYREAKLLFDEAWDLEPIRHLGVRVTDLSDNSFRQISLWESKNFEKMRVLNKTIDDLRLKYGNGIIQRGGFLHSGVKGVSGGVDGGDYPMMKSAL